MKLNVFAKKRTTKEGKVFYSYLSTLHNKVFDTDETVQVFFRDECGAPKGQECPRVIEVKKEDCNLVKRNVTVIVNEEEKEIEVRRLWVSDWKDCGAYVDRSLDDYDFE